MKQKAVFLDRDGVINEDRGYISNIADFHFLPGVFEALKLLQKNNYLLILVTNQSGIGVGKYTHDEFRRVTNYMLAELERRGICFGAVQYCPHKPDEGCACRKPNRGMIDEVLVKLDIDLRYSFFVGDKTSDIKLGNDIGCRSLLVRTGAAGTDKKCDAVPAYIVADLAAAARVIVESSKKIRPLDELKSVVAELKKQARKIVTLNGSFDVLHPGHAYIIREAKKQGDILILGLNSDSSIKAYKGADRPINSERDRAELLSAFADVDYITFFDEIHPINFIEAIRPHVHVTGTEYGENCIEAETVRKYGQLYFVPRISPTNFSTTAILKKIQSINAEKDECKFIKSV